MNIVIMGGSFNPPTIAHLRIMQAALDAVQAQMGFWVPVSFPYLKRKMMKAGQSHLCLPDELRIRMLDAMSVNDSRIHIFTDMMNNPFSDDVGMVQMMQERYPDACLYYVFGADKLDLLDHFAEKGFLERVCCILFARDGEAWEENAKSREHLAPLLDAIISVDPPEGIEGVSSTVIREHLFTPEVVSDMLHPDVLSILRTLRREDYREEILQFKDEYAYLSNDFPTEVTYDGLSYPNATSAFLGTKTDDPTEKRIISRMNPEKAKQKYQSKAGSDEWEGKKAIILEKIVRQKFQQHPELMERLVSTGSRKLINGGKKDKYAGVNLITWEGKNLLGQILMRIRWEERGE